jgi:hypothetical protein
MQKQKQNQVRAPVGQPKDPNGLKWLQWPALKRLVSKPKASIPGGPTNGASAGKEGDMGRSGQIGGGGKRGVLM